MSFKRRPHSDSDTDTDAAGTAPHAFNQIGSMLPALNSSRLAPMARRPKIQGPHWPALCPAM